MAQQANSPQFRLRRLSAALASCFLSGTVLALPTGANVTHGTAVLSQNGQLLTITNSNGAIINWQGFSIGSGETARFIQPSAVSSVLNRVVTDNPSVILGQLQSNGQVFLINPAGILVGRGARIDVGGFVASSLQLSDADFLAKRFNFFSEPTPGNVRKNPGKVRNEGVIKTAAGGSVYLIAPLVENAGLIQAPGGEVILAAGRKVEIGDTATPGVRAEITGDGKATNVGQIVADAGNIGLVGAVVRNSGLLNASSAVSAGGRVYLRASDKVEQTASGAIDVSGTGGGSVLARADDTTLLDGSVKAVGHTGRGGEIQALGNKVGVIGAADLDASGRTGGGNILVGGDYQGRNAQIPNAEFTYVGAKTTLRADATRSGDGGKVIVWADDATRAYGSISARGGELGGNGGFIETSGKHYLDVWGIRVKADGAAGGAAGQWLLDPDDLTVVAGSADNNLAGNAPYFSNDTQVGGSRISTGTLNAAIAGNTNVSLFATNDVIFDGTYSGDIYVTKNSSDTFSTQLNVSAGVGSVLFKGNTTFQTLGTSGTGGLTVNLAPGAGMSTILSGATLTVDGGVTPLALVPGYPMSHTLENFGTFNLKNNAYVDLGVGGYNSTFINRSTGVVNVRTNGASTAALFPFQSDTIQGGVVINEGVWNADLTSVGQSYEVLFSNAPGADLNVVNGGPSRQLSLQNADQLSGGINIGSGSTLWLSEMHANNSASGAYVYFSGADVNGPGILKVGGGSYDVLAKFDGASLNGAAKLWLASGSGGTGGDVEFFGAQSTLNGSSIFWGRPSAWTVPSTSQLALTGGVGFYSASDLYVDDLITPGALYLAAGWDGASFLPTPTVSNAGSVNIFGAVSSGGAMWVRARDDIRVEAADGVVSLVGGGTSQQLIAGGDVKVRGGVGTAIVRYNGSGIQTISADKVIVEGDTAGGDDHWAKIRSEGRQTVQAASSVVVQGGGYSLGGGHGNFAAIEAMGNQVVRAPAIGLFGGAGGSTGYDNFAAIAQLSSSGQQKIVLTTVNGLSLTGGSGFGTTTWTGSECPTGCMVSNNGAHLRNKGSGGQEIDFLAGGSLALQGGSAGSWNDAQIANDGPGPQKIWSSTGSHPDITVTGGTSGGYYDTVDKRNFGNEAVIGSDSSQVVLANSLTLSGGGDSTTVGGAMVVAPLQNIAVTNDLSMVGGYSTVAGEYGMGTPTVIGYDDGADITVAVGGSVNAAGNVGATGGLVMIGAARGAASIDITADSLNFGARSYLGNVDQSAGGSVALTATAGGISQNASFSRTFTGTLTALATDAIDFGYDSHIGYADLYTTSGDVLLRSSTATTHLTRLRTDNGSVTAINGTGNLALGEIKATGSVSLTSRQAILDDNASGAVNVTAPSIYLTSQSGGKAGGLAISADVQSPGGAVSAYVGYEGAPANGGVRLESLGTAAPSSLSITDTALAGGDIFYKYHGNLASNANFSVSSASGSLIFGATGSLELAGGTFVAPDGLAFAAAGGDLNVSGSLALASASRLVAAGNLTVGGAIAASAATTLIAGGGLDVGGSISATRLNATAGGAMSVNGGLIATSGPVSLDVGDLHIAGGSISASGALVAEAANVSIENGLLHSDSGLSLSADNLLVKNGGKIIAQNGNLGVAATQDIKVLAGGEIKAPAGRVTLLADRDLSVDGMAVAGTTAVLDALNNLNIGGSVVAPGATSLIAGGGLAVSGTVSASQVSATVGGAMSVNGGSIAASGPIALDVGNLQVLNGSVVAGGGLDVSAANVSVENGLLQSGSGVVLVTTNLLVNNGGKVMAQNGNVRAEAAQDIKVLAGGEIKAAVGSVALLTDRDLIVDGGVVAGTTARLDALNNLNVGGSVVAAGATSLITGAGLVVSGTVSGSQMNATVGGAMSVNGGAIAASGPIALDVGDLQVLNGSVVAGGGLDVSAANVSVENGLVQSGSGVLLTATNLLVKNGGKIIAQNGNVRAEADQDIKVLVGGEIKAAAGSVSLQADRDLAVDGVVAAGTNVTLNALNNIAVGGHAAASGAATLVAGGGVALAGEVDCANLELTAGGDLVMDGGGLKAVETILLKATNVSLSNGALIKTEHGHVAAEIGQDMRLLNGSKILAGDDVKLRFAAVDSKLTLNDVAGLAPSVIEADRYTMVPATIYLDFLAASAGGVIIDGIETTSTQAGGSGFYAAGSTAVSGAGLQLTYGVPQQSSPPINDVLNTKPPITDSGSQQGMTTSLLPPTGTNDGQLASGGSTTTNDEFGGGSATGDDNESKNRNRRRGGMCRS